ncbi:small subunit rRNA maturation protein LCP5 NDAI_0B02480 [Naumovozyma dairenensis CBS 421]|uniref:Uncharacterized protein n=1 Tax=Naumovozyma dairenensis (strain ATCC 10597 / BCRC 20456 / CBS 421 / NBRC 0211 / NRRL Y-12639) TaxID=1071378 RepID=G0W672_NAUDC|nr:hypothetical protein NDAI_0B02480 [Naumovozyma dairenensis CBS 421]CCD23283.1 hypothetical protein NDAI_0B02480 [Naumovozyma dairenensis CBS 421]
MSELNSILKEMNASLETVSESIEILHNNYLQDHEETEQEGGNNTDDTLHSYLKLNKNEKVSLLSLKNDSMLSYINSLLLIVGNKLKTRKGNNDDDVAFYDLRDKTIENRVVVERGIKPLEKKLSYQLDKLIRAYYKAEKEFKDAENRAIEKSALHDKKESTNSDDDDDSGSEEDEDEEMAYRPNTTGLTKTSSKEKAASRAKEQEEGEGEGEGDGTEGADENESGIYRPPKINAMLPPTQQSSHFEDKFIVKEHKNRSNHSRMQAMEEYLKDQTDQPDWESSIGANIVNHGKGGIKSSRASEKERKVTSYEEDNFTRLNNLGTSKIEKKKQKQRERMAKVNIIGGEDFSIFNSKRKMEDSTSRRGNKKSRSAWDRAKRRL